MAGRTLGEMRCVRWCLLGVRNACWCLGLPLAMSNIYQGWYGSVWAYLRVSRWCWRVYGELRAVSGSNFPSISFNFRKSQMRSLTFSRRPGGPRCLKYQNVPQFWSSWAIGKSWERFQSWVISVYFLTIPDDHTISLSFSLASSSTLHLDGGLVGCSFGLA